LEEEVFVRAVRGTGVLSGQSVINTFLDLALFMFFARIVSRYEMGVYGAVLLVYMVLAILGSLGLSFAASHFLPHFYGKNEYRKVKSTVERILTITLVSAFIFCLVQIVFASFLSDLLFGTSVHAHLFWLTGLGTFAAILGTVSCGFVSGLQKFGSLALFRFLSQVVRVSITVWLLLLGFGVASIFLGWIVFFSALAGLALFLTIREVLGVRMEGDLNLNNGSLQFKVLLGFSLPMLVYQFVSFLSDSVDRFIVLGFLGTAPLGVYTVALTVTNSIIMIFGYPLLITLVPGMSEAEAKIGVESVSNSFRLVSRYVSLIFIPICFGIAVLSPLVVNVLAGLKYVEAAFPLSIVCFGLSIYGFSVGLISVLTALGKTLRVAVAVLLASSIGLSLSLLFVPVFGVLGAAISRAVMYISMFGLLFYLASRIIHPSFDKQAIWKSCVASVVMVFTVFYLAYLTGYVLTLLPLYLFVSLTVYGIMLMVLRFPTAQDARFLVKIIPQSEKLVDKIKKFIKSHV